MTGNTTAAATAVKARTGLTIGRATLALKHLEAGGLLSVPKRGTLRKLATWSEVLAAKATLTPRQQKAMDRFKRYRLPRIIDVRLTDAVRDLRNAEAVTRLAVFLGRFHTAPGRLGRVFPVDRIALAAHGDLNLSEARVRGALAALERLGLLVREAMTGSAYWPTAEGLHRKPVFWRFALRTTREVLTTMGFFGFPSTCQGMRVNARKAPISVGP